MRRLAVTALILGLNIGCRHATPAQPDPDPIRAFGLPGPEEAHAHDLLCVMDHTAPGLQTCVTMGRVWEFMHGVSAN